MTYDTSGIQQEGRTIQESAQVGIITGEHGEGKGSEKKKGPRYSTPKPPINRRNEMTWYWMQNEIWTHDDSSVFPSWGCLLARYRENQKRDHKAAYARRQAKELAYKKEYRQRQSVKDAHAKRQRDKKASDPGYRVKKNLADRLRSMIISSGSQKEMTTLEFVGCTASQLRDHIERQFAKWMNWSNYGTKWQVDHIIPCAAFDHSDTNQVRQCWHFSNLRPLCAIENASKRDTITEPQMKLLL